MAKDKLKDLHDEAMRRFRACSDADSNKHTKAQEERRFEAGEQWPEDVRANREGDPNGPRPCLVVNRIPAFKHQVLNELRQQNQQIKVFGVDDAATEEAAKFYSGKIRKIRSESNAIDAYEWGADQCVSCGWGYWEVATEWEGETFQQRITIKRIKNQWSVYLDPSREELDGSDARFGFKIKQIPKKTFEERWPDKHYGFPTDGSAELTGDWWGEETCTVASYWYLEDERVGWLVQFLDGSIGKMNEEEYTQAQSNGWLMNAREIISPVLYQAIMSGNEWLEEPQRRPGRYIPIVEMIGVEEIVDNRVEYSGIVRDLIDPQRNYNYMRSARVERVALEPKAPWVGYEGQFKSPKWKKANRYNYPYLEASHPEGWPRTQPLPLPQRNPGPQLSPGFSEEIALAAQELKDISGIHDAGLGAQTQDISGEAINARRSESDVGQFHFTRALSRSVRHTGRIIMAMIPEVITGTRREIILNNEDDQEPVIVGPGTIQGQQGIDITSGRYELEVSAGPGYATRREKTQQLLFQLANANPDFARLTADWLIRISEAEGSEQIEKRFRTLLPPEILQEENPEVAVAVGQYLQQIQQMQEALDMQSQQLEQLAKALSDQSAKQELDEKELRRKIAKDFADYAVKMTDIEAKSREGQPVNVPGSMI